MDKTTFAASRGQFARISVEVDLNQPLRSKFQLWGHTFPVEYEGLHQICFHCGKYGHRQENCPKVPSSSNIATDGMENNQVTKETEQVKVDLTARYGPWMIAQTRQ